MTSSHSALVLGAVAYDPKVVTIWDGFQAWFGRHGLPFDYVLYSNYERQVAGHLAGECDVAWNSPLAWIEAERAGRHLRRTARAIAMRDTDRDLTSVIVVRADGAIRDVRDLAGKVIAVGAGDSPQATLLPLLHLAEAGLEPGRDFEVQRHDVCAGKHGDHIGGERDAVKALIGGRADAACMIDGNHLVFSNEGTIPPGRARVLARTGLYDHCNMTVFDDAPADLVGRFTTLLLGMSWDDPEVRPLLEMEGLKKWLPGRVTGYAALNRAVDRFRSIEGWLAAASG
jgi:ABC-type phosphate/phosphonate transport system substrate-binding protein